MGFSLVCPACGASFENVPDSVIGKKVKCKKCASLFFVKTAVSGEHPAVPSKMPPRRTRRTNAPPQAGSGKTGPTAPTLSPDWRVGDVILNLYEVTGILGEGGMGMVYKVLHRGWGLELAVKSPKAHVLAKAGGAENFEREAETWVNLGLHPHTVSCYYVRRVGNVPRVFAEYVEGGSLADWIGEKKLYRGGSGRSLERMLDVAIQFAWGLDYSHEQGLIHQDVKPANVMMTPEGIAKVTDFGLARARPMAGFTAEGNQQTMMANRIGMTPAYASPEQAGGKTLTRRTDLWSWGASVLEMFCGEVLWPSGTVVLGALETYLASGPENRVIPVMPKKLADLLKKCFQENPDLRPHTMNMVAETLIGLYKEITGRPYDRTKPMAGRDTAESLNNRAVSLIDLGRVSDAEETWARAVKADSHHIETNFNLAIHRWRHFSLTEEDVYRRLREVGLTHKTDRRYIQLLGRIYLFFGEYRTAEKLLREAVNLDQSVVEAWRDLGLAKGAALGEDGDDSEWQEVEQCLERVFAMDYEDPYVIAGRAFSMLRQGREAEALNFYREFSAKHKNLPQSLTEAVHRYLPGHEVAASAVVPRAPQIFDLKIDPDGNHLRFCTSSKIVIFKMAVDSFETAVEYSLSQEGIKTMRFSGAGHMALSGDNDDHMRVWDANNGRLIRKTRQPVTGKIVSIGFSPTGDLAAAGGSTGTIFLYNMKSGERLMNFEGHELNVGALAFDPKGRFIVSGSADHTLRLWSLENGQCLHLLKGHEALISTVIFTQNGNYILSASDDFSLRLWDVKTGRRLRTFIGHTGPISAAAFLPGGRWMVSASHDKTVRLWELETTSPQAIYRFETRIEALAVSPDGRRAILVRADLRARNLKNILSIGLEFADRYRAPYAVSRPVSAAVVDALEIEFQEKQKKAEQLLEKARYAEALDLLVDLRGLSGYDRDDRALSLWSRLVARFPRKKLRSTWKAAATEKNGQPVLSATFSPDGLKILAGGGDKQIIVWDPAREEDPQALGGHTGQVTAVALDQAGQKALSGSWDGILRLWDMETGTPVLTLNHGARLTTAALSPDNRHVLSGAEDRTIRLWDLKTEKCLRVLEGHTEEVTALAFSPDGRYAVSGSLDKTLCLWDLTTGKAHQVLEGHTQGVTSLAITPDGKRVFSGSLDQTLREWDLTTASLVRTYDAHRQPVRAVDISPDGRCALTGGDDLTVCLWDLTARTRLSVFEGHKEAVTTVAFAPDGQSFAVGSRDGQMTYWRLDWEPEVRRSSNWQEEARPLMEIFLTLMTPYGESPPERKGRARWDENDFSRFLARLGQGGYGWLNSMGVERELDDTSRLWSGPKEVAKIFPLKKRPGWFRPDSGLALSILAFPLRRWKAFLLLSLLVGLIFWGVPLLDHLRGPVVTSIPFGFNDVDFDMKKKDLGPLVLVEQSLGTITYIRENEKLTFENIRLKKILYTFNRGVLSIIKIYPLTQRDKIKLLEYFIKEYGQPRSGVDQWQRHVLTWNTGSRILILKMYDDFFLMQKLSTRLN